MKAHLQHMRNHLIIIIQGLFCLKKRNKNLKFIIIIFSSKPRNSNVICNNILDMVGNTPLVQLKNIANDYEIKCNLCKFHRLIIYKTEQSELVLNYRRKM
jgi:hypothetical protein